MQTNPDDIVYLVAVRTNGENRGRALQEVMRIVDAVTRDDDATEYEAHVLAARGDEAYHLPANDARREAGGEAPMRVQNLNDVLLAAGFSFDTANAIVPVAVEAPA